MARHFAAAGLSARALDHYQRAAELAAARLRTVSRRTLAFALDALAALRRTRSPSEGDRDPPGRANALDAARVATTRRRSSRTSLASRSSGSWLARARSSCPPCWGSSSSTSHGRQPQLARARPCDPPHRGAPRRVAAHGRSPADPGRQQHDRGLLHRGPGPPGEGGRDWAGGPISAAGHAARHRSARDGPLHPRHGAS